MNETNGKYVVILSKFNSRSFPLNEKAIWVSNEDLEQIEKTKCFDVENNCVIDYDNSEQERVETLKMESYRAGRYLVETDYIANKLAEAISKYIETGDNTEVLLLRNTYKEQLKKRAECRKTINEIDVQLESLGV